MKNKKELIRAVKFTLFSISAGIIQVLSFTLMNEVFKWNYSICYFIALVLSVLWNFTLNRNYTFKSANNVGIAMIKVALYYLVFTPTSTYLGAFFENKGVNEYIVLAVSMITNFVTEFLYDKYVVFRNSIDTRKDKRK